MSKFKAVEDIKKLARFVQGITDFANEVEKLASLENYEQELKLAVEMQEKKVQEIKLKNEQAQIDLAKAEELAAKSLELEKVKAKQALEQAIKQAESVKAQAKLEADQKLKEAGEIAAGLHVKCEDLKSQIEALKVEAQEKKQVVAQLNAEIESIKAKLS